MKVTRKLRALVLAFALAVTMIPAMSVETVMADESASIDKEMTCYIGVAASIDVENWRSDADVTWTAEDGTGSVKLSAQKNWSVKVTGVTVGTATVTYTAVYTDSDTKKQVTDTCSCTVTVEEVGSAPKLIKVTKKRVYNGIQLTLKFDKPVEPEEGDSSVTAKSLARNFTIKIGNKTYTSKKDFGIFEIYSGDSPNEAIIYFEESTVKKAKASIKKKITVSVKSTATIKGLNGKKISKSSKAVTAKTK